MSRVLLTAFEPYDRWSENASWLALADLTNWYEGPVKLTTRRYPLRLSAMSERLRKDLQEDYDHAIHIGQAVGSAWIQLQSIGLNVGCDGSPLVTDGPEAYRSPLPLASYANVLKGAGIPAAVSYHAGTDGCNAAMYLSQHYAASFGMRTKGFFVHLPLAPAQVAKSEQELASMSTPMCSAAIAMLIAQIGAA